MFTCNVQTQLVQRITRLAQHLHFLIPSIQSGGLRLEEEDLRGKLEEIEEEMRRARVECRVNELWALIGARGTGVKAGASARARCEWTVVERRVSSRLRKYWQSGRPSCSI